MAWLPNYQRLDNFPLSPLPTQSLTRVWRVANGIGMVGKSGAVLAKRTDDAFTLSLRIRGAVMSRAGKPGIPQNPNVIRVDLNRLGGRNGRRNEG